MKRFLATLFLATICITMVADCCYADEYDIPNMTTAQLNELKEKINKELEQYSEKLLKKPQIVAANKIDLIGEDSEEYQDFKAYVEEQHMLEKKDRVIVGVSGGADSVCLLFVLTKLRDERQKSGDGTLEITAVHVHHGLRGDSADADERYVRKICDAWNVPLVVYHKNIRELAKC